MVQQAGFEPATSRSSVQQPNHYTLGIRVSNSLVLFYTFLFYMLMSILESQNENQDMVPVLQCYSTNNLLLPEKNIDLKKRQKKCYHLGYRVLLNDIDKETLRKNKIWAAVDKLLECPIESKTRPFVHVSSPNIL